jgi:hypothetical protein
MNSVIETLSAVISLYQNVATLPLSTALNLAKTGKEAQEKCRCNAKGAEN